MKGSDGNTIALVHEQHGTIFVYDTQELDRHLKLGWKRRPDNWKEDRYVANIGLRQAANKAEQKRLQEEAAELERKAAALDTGEKPKRVVGADVTGDGVIDQVFAEKPKKAKAPAKAKKR